MPRQFISLALLVLALSAGLVPTSPAHALVADTVTITVEPGNWYASAFEPGVVYAPGDTIVVTASVPLRIVARFDGKGGQFLVNGRETSNPFGDSFWTIMYGGVWLGSAPDNFHLRGDASEVGMILFITEEDLQGRTVDITFTRVRR